MFQPDTLLQYVGDVDVSVGFYAGIIGRPPVEHSPGFALFVFPGGRALGLWRRDAVQPIVYGNAGATSWRWWWTVLRRSSACTRPGSRLAW